MAELSFQVESVQTTGPKPTGGLRDRSEIQTVILAALTSILEGVKADFTERFGAPTPPSNYRRFPKTHPSGSQPVDRIKAWPVEAIIGANADGSPRMTPEYLRFAVSAVLSERIRDILRTQGGENGEWRVLSVTPVMRLDRERLPVTSAPEGGTEKFILHNPSWVADAGARPDIRENYREVETVYFDVVFVDVSGNPWLQRDGLGRPVDNAAATGTSASGQVGELVNLLRGALQPAATVETPTEIKVEGDPKKVAPLPPRPKA